MEHVFVGDKHKTFANNDNINTQQKGMIDARDLQ